jgi:hypothetical protein
MSERGLMSPLPRLTRGSQHYFPTFRRRIDLLYFIVTERLHAGLCYHTAAADEN